MVEVDLERLRSYTDRGVSIKTVDGENLVAKIIFLQDEYQDFIYDMVSTDRPEIYRTAPEKTAYVMPYRDVLSFELVEEGL